MASDREIQEMVSKILKDLEGLPSGRYYPKGLPARLWDFIFKHVPEAEVIKHKGGEVLKLKSRHNRLGHP